jgi:CRISPR-associated protein Cas1
MADLRKGERRAVYVQTQGAYCSYRSGQLRVTLKGKELLSLPISVVGPLVVTGAVTLSSGLRNALLWNEIELVVQSRRGRYLGRLDSGANDAGLIRRQYEATGSEDQRIKLAKPIVAGKIANMRALLLRYNRRENLPHLHGATTALRDAYRDLKRHDELDEILGAEGNASRIYFGGLEVVLPEWAGFTGRNRQPPRDPGNAALSYGYALLLGETVAACRAAGLDPSCGFLHSDDRKRPSLALDLMEEFRPLIVDATVVELMRRSRLRPDHFERRGEASSLTPTGRRVLVESIEQRLITEFNHVPSGRKTYYRRALLLQAQQVASILRRSSNKYRAVPWR